MVGGLIAVSIAANVIYGVFSLVTLLVAVLMWRHDDGREDPSEEAVDPGRAGSGILVSSYVDQATRRQIEYTPRRLGFGMSLSSIAGVLSGLLGVGGGFLKVPAMTLAMDVPAKAAAATSNFMVGITAVASLVIYLARGFVQPAVAVPVTLGIVLGAVVMSQFTNKVSGLHIQRVLSVILAIIAVQMALESAGLVNYG